MNHPGNRIPDSAFHFDVTFFGDTGKLKDDYVFSVLQKDIIFSPNGSYLDSLKDVLQDFRKVKLFKDYNYSQYWFLRLQVINYKKKREELKGASIFNQEYRKAFNLLRSIAKKYKHKLNDETIEIFEADLEKFKRVLDIAKFYKKLKIADFSPKTVDSAILLKIKNQIRVEEKINLAISTPMKLKYVKVYYTKEELGYTKYSQYDSVPTFNFSSNISKKINAPVGIWNVERLDIYNADNQIVKMKKNVEIDLGEFKMPFNGRVTSGFGYRHWRPHTGTDIDLEKGDTVFAAFSGTVRFSDYHKGYGNCVVIEHENGLETLYGHFSKRLVKNGEEVKAGQVIGLGGNTGRSFGAHLHFETRFLGEPFDASSIIDFKLGALKNKKLVVTKSLFKFAKPIKYDNTNHHYLKYQNHNHIAQHKEDHGKKNTVKFVYNKNAKYHTVKSGHTLGHIASWYKTSVSKLCALNGLSKKSVLQIGQKIRVK